MLCKEHRRGVSYRLLGDHVSIEGAMKKKRITFTNKIADRLNLIFDFGNKVLPCLSNTTLLEFVARIIRNFFNR